MQESACRDRPQTFQQCWSCGTGSHCAVSVQGPGRGKRATLSSSIPALIPKSPSFPFSLTPPSPFNPRKNPPGRADSSLGTTSAPSWHLALYKIRFGCVFTREPYTFFNIVTLLALPSGHQAAQLFDLFMIPIGAIQFPLSFWSVHTRLRSRAVLCLNLLCTSNISRCGLPSDIRDLV